MKKLLTFLFSSLLYFSVQSQDSVVDILQWNVIPDVNNAFILNPAVISSNYSASTYVLNQPYGSGATWNGVDNNQVDLNGYVLISFTVGSSNFIDVTNIQYSIASTWNNGLFNVQNYRLDYRVNGTSTTLIDLPNGVLAETSSSGPYVNDTLTISSPETLEPGDIFEVIWYPFNPISVIAPSFNGLFIADSTAINAIPTKISGVIRPLSTVNPVTDFTYTSGCASAGKLEWTNPDLSNRQVLVFAKKITYIDQGTPDLDPSTYGTPITDLSQMTVSVPVEVQYENDAEAMLVYSGIGMSVNLTNFEDTVVYQFAAFVVDTTNAPSYVYSNAKLTSGSSAIKLNDIVSYTALSKPIAADLTFVQPNCMDKIVVVANLDSAITVAPSGTNNFTASSVWGTFTSGTGKHNTGQVMYNDVETGVNLTNLTNGQVYGISIWIESAGNWSTGTFFTVYPEEYEIIITQVKAVDDDAVEFLTLKEIDFSIAKYNLGSFPACNDGIIIGPSSLGQEVGESFFNSIKLNDNIGDVIPAGTFIRVIKGDWNNNNLEAFDGLVTLYSISNLALEESGGDQAMVFISDADGYDISDCSGGNGIQNLVKSAINFGNDGWLEPGSTTNPSVNLSYAPPSVSNLAQPAGIPDLYPNYSLKDQYPISGDIAAIHSTISETDNSDVWSANNEANMAILKLKNIQFDSTDFNSVIGDVDWLSYTDDTLNVNLSVLNFDDETDTRYMVVVNAVFQGDVPIDRFTCYWNVNTNYGNTPSVVTEVNGQVNSGNPCGTPVDDGFDTVKGFGKIVYLNRYKDTTITVDGLPCGSRIYVDVYAVKGNGYTMSLGVPASSSILPTLTPIDYYSLSGGSIESVIWSTDTTNTGDDLGEFSPCANLIVRNTHHITNNLNEVSIGSLTVKSGGSFTMGTANTLSIERDLTIDGTFTPITSTVSMNGVYGHQNGAQIISGTSSDISFYNLRMNNTSSISSDETNNDVNINININIIYGLWMDDNDADVIVETGKTLTLVSNSLDNAAFLGILGDSASVSGTFIIQRYLPQITTGVNNDNTYGTGYRMLGSPVQNANFEQFNDDMATSGFVGADYPLWEFGGYIFPTISKYDETVLGDKNLGYDSDPHPSDPAPAIRVYRDNLAPETSTNLSPAEGVRAYFSSIDYVSDETTLLDAVGTPNTGLITIPLSYTSSSGGNLNDGWHIVSNPYPCAIDWKKVLELSAVGADVDAAIYIWNTDGGISDYVELSSALPGEQYIAAQQAFWVKVNNAAVTLIFGELSKIEDPNGAFYKSDDDEYEEALIVNVNSEDSTYSNRAIVWFVENATEDFDSEYDSYKLYGKGYKYPVISSNIDGFDAHVSTNAIPELTEDNVITFNLFVREAGNYNLSFKENGYILPGSCVTMTDLVNDTTFIVDESTVYSFYSELRADTLAPMFSMTISPSISVESTDATCFEGDNGTVTALGVGDGPFTYSWYNANNELVMEEITSETSMLDSLAQGYYSVEIDGNNTFCELTSNEIFISQPTPFVNSTVKTNPLSCTYADGFIYVTVDERAVWDITWTNVETGYTNEALAVTGTYEISNLGPGTYEVVTSTDCGAPIIFEETLTDNNDVVADFTMSADTIWIANGGEADFLNTSENADHYYWIYDNASAMPDSSYDGSYTYTEAGIYGVTLLAQNGDACSDIITQELVVMADPNSVDDLTNEIVRSYITYNSGNAQYVIELKEAKNVQVQMLNSMGQLINTQEVNVDGKTFVDLPTYNISSGIYIIITLDDGTRIDSKKLFVR